LFQDSLFLRKEAKRFKVKVGVYLLLIQGDKILLLRRYNTGIGDGTYVPPMGGLNDGETASEALIREAREETNIILKPDNIHLCHVMHRLHRMPDGYTFTQMDMFFRANSYKGAVKNLEPHKCDELGFYPISALPQNIETYIPKVLDCVKKDIFFSEFGWRKKESYKC
jgi:ADP-ribose pyrophosphatase YjhB (NUDIX family)